MVKKLPVSRSFIIEIVARANFLFFGPYLNVSLKRLTYDLFSNIYHFINDKFESLRSTIAAKLTVIHFPIEQKLTGIFKRVPWRTLSIYGTRKNSTMHCASARLFRL